MEIKKNEFRRAKFVDVFRIVFKSFREPSLILMVQVILFVICCTCCDIYQDIADDVLKNSAPRKFDRIFPPLEKTYSKF